MKTIKSKLTVIGVISVMLFISSCSNSSKQKANKTNVATEIDKKQVEKEVAEFVYPLPTAFEVSKMLNKIGAAYILSLSNPAENVSKYLSTKSKALNLGIYGADLSYASTYNQKQITIDYMDASNQLVEDLDFSQSMEKDMVEKLEESENDKEELIDYITTTFYDTYEFLNKNNRGEVAMLILAGSWVEGIYIVTNISDNTYNNIEMVRIVMEQKEPLNKLIDLLKQYSNDNSVTEVMKDLEKVQTIFNAVQEGSISEQQMKDITAEIKSIREKYVS